MPGLFETSPSLGKVPRGNKPEHVPLIVTVNNIVSDLYVRSYTKFSVVFKVLISISKALYYSPIILGL